MSKPLLMAAIGNLADSCPASITTLAGTVAADVSLLASAIVIGWLAGLAIETVPVGASSPAALLIGCGARVRLGVGMLSSITTALSEPATNAVDAAVIVTLVLPSIWSSLIAVRGNVGAARPAGLV